MVVSGVPTTAPFHCLILDNEAFNKGDVDTGFIVKHADELKVSCVARCPMCVCVESHYCRSCFGFGRCVAVPAIGPGLASWAGTAAGREGATWTPLFRRVHRRRRLLLRRSEPPSLAVRAHLPSQHVIFDLHLQEPPKMKDMSLVSDAGKRGLARRKAHSK